MGLFSEIKTQLYDPNNPEMMEEEEDDNTWDTSAQIAGVVPQFETLPLLVMGYLVDSSSHNMLWLGA